jgi:LysR family nitrogen assimilation transcriptional regulator
MRLILPSHPHGLRLLVEALLGARKLYPKVEYEIDSLSAVVNMVEQGIGYTILPYAAVSAKVENGSLTATSIIEPRMTRQLVLATSTQRPVTIATRTLIKVVTQLVRNLVNEGVWLPRA